ncbi:MAG: hypothetical protein ACP6IQ_03530 [Candidatus Njordarchaeia archaeon]
MAKISSQSTFREIIDEFYYGKYNYMIIFKNKGGFIALKEMKDPLMLLFEVERIYSKLKAIEFQYEIREKNIIIIVSRYTKFYILAKFSNEFIEKINSQIRYK